MGTFCAQGKAIGLRLLFPTGKNPGGVHLPSGLWASVATLLTQLLGRADGDFKSHHALCTNTAPDRALLIPSPQNASQLGPPTKPG